MSDERKETAAERTRRKVEERLAARSGDLIGDDEPVPPTSGVPSEEPSLSEWPEHEAVPPIEEPDEQAEKRARLLASIPEELRARFPDSRLDQIIAEAEQKALEEKEKAIMRDLRGLASSHARADLDLIPAGDLVDQAHAARMNEKVWITINCPGGAAGAGDVGYRISGLIYKHGQRYLVSRHVASQLMRMDYDAWYHEVLFKTLDQHKPGNSAVDIMAQSGPHTRLEDPFDMIGKVAN